MADIDPKAPAPPEEPGVGAAAAPQTNGHHEDEAEKKEYGDIPEKTEYVLARKFANWLIQLTFVLVSSKLVATESTPFSTMSVGDAKVFRK